MARHDRLVPSLPGQLNQMLQTAPYLALFLLGLALAVHVMLHGVERWRRDLSDKTSPLFNPPTVAALAIGFGAAGYLLRTRSGLTPGVVFAISLVIGALTLSGMIVLMAKWALKTDGTTHSEEEELNGQVAIVSQAITSLEPGEITWHAWNREHTLPASTAGDADIPIGTEVVIDLVENGIAQVELWSVVERRL